MLDYAEYTIDGDGYQGNGNGYHGNGHNGYDQLDGDYATYYKVANGFTGKVKSEDREDFLHDLFVAFAKVKVSYDAKGKELTIGGLVRVAQYELADYWRKHFKRINGINCSQCSKAQREKCKDWYLYPDCPKAVKMERLDRLVEDGNGDSTELHELIADDNAVDVVAMLNARHILKGYPHKAVKLAYKRYAGYPLDVKERDYLSRFRRKLQKTLF
jgi:hypothetical protein